MAKHCQYSNENRAEKDDIYSKLNEFICTYNAKRDIEHQFNGDTVIQCFIDNDIDYTNKMELRKYIMAIFE